MNLFNDEPQETKPIGAILNLDLETIKATKRGKHDDDIENLIEKFENQEGNTLPVVDQKTSASVVQRFNTGFKSWLDDQGLAVRGIQTPMGMRELRATYKYIVILVPNTDESSDNS